MPYLRATPFLTLLCAVALSGCGGPPPLEWITGRVEVPDGIDADDMVVWAFRGASSTPCHVKATFGHSGPRSFELAFRDSEPVNLVAGNVPIEGWTKPDRRVWGSDRQAYAVDGHWGTATAVRPGARDVVIRLEPFRFASLRVRALDPAGQPAPGCRVRLTLAERPDWISGQTDEAGFATFDDVPVRSWIVEVSPGRSDWPRLAPGREEVTPSNDVVDVSLRRAVQVRVRILGEVPPKAFLMVNGDGQNSYLVIGWLADEAGSMDIGVEPQLETVSIALHRPVGESSSEAVARATVKVREGAGVELVVPK